jgi:hypothetical protein
MLRYVILLIALLLTLPASAQIKCSDGMEPLDRSAESRTSAQDFIKEVATNEVVFSRAYASFGYKAEIDVKTLLGDTVDGEYRRVSTVDFDANGQRRETVIEGPTNTLTRLKLGEHDFDTLREAFTLTAAKVSDNDIVYSGRQQIGDINAAVFDLLPRKEVADVRGFEGRVWVRVRDSAIMRSCGRSSAAPIGPLRFESIRMLVADKYWFPALIRADEDARVGQEEKVHVRVTVKYSDYKAR